MNLRFDEDTDTPDPVKLYLSILIFVPVAHPIQSLVLTPRVSDAFLSEEYRSNAMSPGDRYKWLGRGLLVSAPDESIRGNDWSRNTYSAVHVIFFVAYIKVIDRVRNVDRKGK